MENNFLKRLSFCRSRRLSHEGCKNFFKEFLRKERKYPAKITSKCPLIVKGKIILGRNQNEKLSSLPPAVSVKQTASKTL